MSNEQDQTKNAPTTAEVAKRFDSLNRARVSSRINCEEFAEYVTLREVAIPIAEDRDRQAAEVARLTKLLDGLAEHAARGSRAALEAAMVAIYDDWRARMAAMAAKEAGR